ncbi:MAG: serine hydrolase [Oceanicaulis sp.]|uniref:serine hydrolase domain-containing protein n=1 Tax=Glycocaulis sp. TaxID=1969725 RepID=UPI0025C23E2D|nr:serine hydrolase [Glycocaulis sp.]MCC5982287.1 serine hydrolase [Oceanicaulis sp.]MCH8520721.1 beta-lactamase family protein [Glycocaulis sp.]
MKRILIGLVAVIIFAGLAFGGWYYRPWSPYSPANVRALDDPEQYVTTFQRMDEILPNAVISATNGAPLPRNLQPLEVTYEWEGEIRSLDDYLDAARVTGLTVLRDGEVIHQRFFHGADEATRFTSWSVGKSFVASLIAMALDDGLIESLDDPAERYAPEYAGTYYGSVSLRNLLMMSAGIDFNEEYSPDRPSDVRPFFFNAFILGRSPDTLARAFGANDKVPGEHFHYASTNTQVLSAVASNVFAGTLAEVVADRIWTPLGMNSDATWLQHVPGNRGVAVGYCCLQATSEDYARFGQLYLQDGVWNGTRLLPEGWVREATRPVSPHHEAGATPAYGPRGYGLHFWIPENHDGEYFFAGVYGQYIWVDERRGVVIAQNAGDPAWGRLGTEAFAVFRAIAETVSPLAVEPEPVEEAQDEPVLDAPLGVEEEPLDEASEEDSE